MSITTLYTLGHADRTLEEILELLDQTGINVLVDIRATPQSKGNPHFSQEFFRLALEQTGKTYHWAGRQLGENHRGDVNSQHIALQDEALRGYADYMELDTFKIAAMQLINMAHEERTVILCRKILPDHCYRSLLSDYLTLQGINVIHLISDSKVKDHCLSRYARRESIELVYDRTV